MILVDMRRRLGQPQGESMEWRDRITADPKVLVGKPVVKGTRLAVEFVLELLASGWTQDQILANYPGLSSDDILACLAYAKEVVREERIFPLAQH
jgi:uncharacterized protein (DUF433 family)